MSAGPGTRGVAVLSWCCTDDGVALMIPGLNAKAKFCGVAVHSWCCTDDPCGYCGSLMIPADPGTHGVALMMVSDFPLKPCRIITEPYDSLSGSLSKSISHLVGRDEVLMPATV